MVGLSNSNEQTDPLLLQWRKPQPSVGWGFRFFPAQVVECHPSMFGVRRSPSMG